MPQKDMNDRDLEVGTYVLFILRNEYEGPDTQSLRYGIVCNEGRDWFNIEYVNREKVESNDSPTYIYHCPKSEETVSIYPHQVPLNERRILVKG